MADWSPGPEPGEVCKTALSDVSFSDVDDVRAGYPSRRWFLGRDGWVSAFKATSWVQFEKPRRGQSRTKHHVDSGSRRRFGER